MKLQRTSDRQDNVKILIFKIELKIFSKNG